jgi:hypothetical protein
MFLKNSKSDKNQNLVSKIDELLEINTEEPKEHLLWNDFEAIIGKIMNPTNRSISNDSKENISKIIEEFTQNFHSYLIKLPKNQSNKINKTILKDFENASTVLTFNYTSFYSIYSENNVADVFHIHGTLSNNNLPIIGYYYPNTSENKNSIDYSVKFSGKLIHKPALALKQNDIDFNSRLTKFINNRKSKFSEIVIMGYSFGSSDSHIYTIINNLIIEQLKDLNIPISQANKVKPVKIVIYNYDEDESKKLIEKIKKGIKKYNRRLSINVTGVGFTPEVKEIITFELKNY